MGAERAAAMQRMTTAMRVMVGSSSKRAINSWKQRVRDLAPLRRGAAHWRNKPATKAIFKLHFHAQKRIQIRGKIYRLQHKKLGDCYNTWVHHATSNRQRSRPASSWFMRAERKAINTWLHWSYQRRRLRGLLMSFKKPRYRYG